MVVVTSLHYGGDFAIDFCFSSCGSSEGCFANIAFHNICRVTINELFVTTVGAAHPEEVGFGFRNKGFPVGAHDLGLTSNG